MKVNEAVNLIRDNKEVWWHVGSISKIELEDKIKGYEIN